MSKTIKIFQKGLYWVLNIRTFWSFDIVVEGPCGTVPSTSWFELRISIFEFVFLKSTLCANKSRSKQIKFHQYVI